jgi:hypothetical protein
MSQSTQHLNRAELRTLIEIYREHGEYSGYQVHYASFDNRTGVIFTGRCALQDMWAQEANSQHNPDAPFTVVVPTDGPYMPDELYLDTDYVVRHRNDRRRVDLVDESKPPKTMKEFKPAK